MQHPICRLLGHNERIRTTDFNIDRLCTRCGRHTLEFINHSMNIANHERVEDNTRVLDEGSWKLGKTWKKTIIYRIFSISTEFIVPALILIVTHQALTLILEVASANTAVCAVLHTAFYYYCEKRIC